MGRLLGLVLLAFLLGLCLRAVLRFLQASIAPTAPGAPDARSLPVDTLVRCAVCGVYVSGQRTLPGERGGAYCSEPCRRQAEAAAATSSS